MQCYSCVAAGQGGPGKQEWMERRCAGKLAQPPGCLSGAALEPWLTGEQNHPATENTTGCLLVLDGADPSLRGLANAQLLSFWQQVKIMQTAVGYLPDQLAGPHPAPPSRLLLCSNFIHNNLQ